MRLVFWVFCGSLLVGCQNPARMTDQGFVACAFVTEEQMRLESEKQDGVSRRLVGMPTEQAIALMEADGYRRFPETWTAFRWLGKLADRISGEPNVDLIVFAKDQGDEQETIILFCVGESVSDVGSHIAVDQGESLGRTTHD